MTANVRIGLIGCGGHGRGRLCPAVAAIDGVDLVACADVDEVAAHRAVSEYGFERFFLDYEEMLSRVDLDAVIVAAPHHLLKEASIAAIQSRCHVFVEKPMGVSRSEGEEIRDAARQAGTTVMVGYCQRYSEGRRLMKELIDRGAVGDVAQVAAAKGSVPLRGWLADPSRGGGQLLYLGVHVTDQILWMVGSQVERVYSEVYWHPETGADQSSAFTLRFHNGVIATVLCTQNAVGSVDFVEAVGPAGRIRAEWPSNVVQVQSEQLAEFRHPTTIRPKEALTQQMYDAELRAWIESIINRREPPISADDGIRVLQTIDAVFESAETGAPVTLT